MPALTNKMIKAARKNLYNRKTGLFVGTGDKQISYASQIWMILSGVASKAEGKKALSALDTTQNVCYPGTPYMYHYYIQSLIDCGMNLEAKEALINYWGGMIAKGADTFWEAYDPTNDFISPYDFYPINSYCHAWSCTPVYFIRKYPAFAGKLPESNYFIYKEIPIKRGRGNPAGNGYPRSERQFYRKYANEYSIDSPPNP